MPRSLNFDTPVITSQHSAAPDVQYLGGLARMRSGSSAMTQALGSYFQPSGSSVQHQGSFFQHQGSFTSSGGYMGTQPAQGSSQFQGSSQVQGFSQVQGSSQVQGFSQVQGSSFQPQGFSSQVFGSMDYPPRPPFTTLQGSNIFQDQGSLRSVQPGSSDVHQGDFIPMQTIATSGPSIIHPVNMDSHPEFQT
ncbi:hypothetical protein HanXRQr2_Chr16g0740931 [Helianthus annuus]|uniref:Uncharacterized protein n=1 Tax=Helianthus annuus TaxID=4232 RepID=A0A9K3DQR8_HELAN|nr:hypothetical protein HanXRQr2_Chr16g0740931 [Helianthus annuus]